MQIIYHLSSFLLYYPLVMSVFWLIGALFYYFLIERKQTAIDYNKQREGITFIVSCFNEAETITATVTNISKLSYPQKELIVINDGSQDDTADVLLKLKELYSFQFIDLKQNQGKANALNLAAKKARYNYIMCVDADTIINDLAPYYMIDNFYTYENLGAVTGNPRIQNKKSLLGKIQTVEFASIIGGIKRAQSMNGYINTISGVFTLLSKKALEDCQYWDIDMVTEDIALSWKMHLHNYVIAYEPHALCWMIVPETLRGLLKQRIRWAQGNQEVLIRDFKKVFKKKSLPFWFLFLEQLVSIVWVTSIVFTLIYLLLNLNFIDYYFYEETLNIILASSFVLITANIILFSVQLCIDSRYERKNMFYFLFLSWYPLFYWMINAITNVFALPKALRRKKGVYATWKSPDRGSKTR
ncbi:poly-beta-1,6-N-acetyl-D-glucosamine synthase [Tetragenococcus halophilus]|uniref:poly-beta-1,6-N-acetyl-D-glucosamine synthase n=2 Tax=Tetragenococcus halophilus TaxID=51669 RepID=UPI000B928BC5|nr:poly-beta-1,6-N-acetyl-D-glucosamine synthase [Tetragenococcus halophilus]MCO8288556.1 poly-beta-1,6 N-acetyl-D-glucosamine synthase [Tetragenococcus halophilus]MCO8291731.1 poly-beta-1,6 N-acetyl-D-glucosamine synthase [Tetragenococcus halophilus]BET70440.1 intracellular adhesion protein A [Tetragenococcus halophilus]BET70444.1 intracellular adhesion protein A [Tetragenococcus halophilus]BET70448.1 intracellular adhesion protein A [Tetragenococcus halophilus]